MKFRLKLLILAITLIAPCLAFADRPEAPTIYVIKQGDTLWGLSERFIKDPHYWPDMWSKNGQITNPHLIYPGQKVRVYPDRLELVPKGEGEVRNATTGTTTAGSAPSAGAAAKGLTEITRERTYTVRGSEGFILESGATSSGTIIGIDKNRNIAGDDDIIYTNIGKDRGAKSGDKFSVFRKDGTVSHPISNEILGTKITPLGMVQLTDIEKGTSRAIIIKTNQEITPGSYLLPARDNNVREISLKKSLRELRGYIVDSLSGVSILATGDIVFVDLGSDHGAEPGNMLYVVREVTIDGSSISGYTERIPQELLGAVVILETGKLTSTAVVVKSIDAIYNGDRLVSNPK